MEEIRKYYDDVSFHLYFKQMPGPDIYLCNITTNLTIYMVKILLLRKLDLLEDQQRLLYNGSVMKDDKSLAYYNVDNSPSILIMRRLRGGARTKATSLLNQSHVLDAVDSGNSDNISSYNSDTSEGKIATSTEDITIEELI